MLAVLHGVLDLQLARFVVQQPDPEGAVVDDAAHRRPDAREQLVEIEHRRDVAADLGQRLERLRVGAASLEQARVDDADRDVRGELSQQLDVGSRELILAVAEDVERADRPLLLQQRHHQLRRHPRDDRHVARVAGHVVDEQRHLAGDGGADQPLALLEPRRFGALGIADRVGDAQVVPPLVEQVDGKGVELDQARDELGDLRDEILEIENRGDLPPQIDEGRERFLLTLRGAVGTHSYG